jgi:hypothetical protein
MPFDVFISHSSKDKPTADAVCAGLESVGIRCWIAPRDIRAGAEYAERIIEGIDACRLMVLIFSSNANESGQVHREIERAVSKGLTIVPFRIEDIVPTKAMEFYLGSIHWLDALTPPVAKHIGRLIEQVKANLQIDAGSGAASQGAFEKFASAGADAGKKSGAGSVPGFASKIAWTGIAAGIVALGVAVFLLLRPTPIIVTQIGPFGGTGGAPFDDLDSNSGHSALSALSVIVDANPADRTQRVIGGLQARWGNRVGVLHGGKGLSAEPASSVVFGQYQKIGRIDINWGSY